MILGLYNGKTWDPVFTAPDGTLLNKDGDMFIGVRPSYIDRYSNLFNQEEVAIDWSEQIYEMRNYSPDWYTLNFYQPGGFEFAVPLLEHEAAPASDADGAFDEGYQNIITDVPVGAFDIKYNPDTNTLFLAYLTMIGYFHMLHGCFRLLKSQVLEAQGACDPKDTHPGYNCTPVTPWFFKVSSSSDECTSPTPGHGGRPPCVAIDCDDCQDCNDCSDECEDCPTADCPCHDPIHSSSSDCTDPVHEDPCQNMRNCLSHEERIRYLAESARETSSSSSDHCIKKYFFDPQTTVHNIALGDNDTIAFLTTAYFEKNRTLNDWCNIWAKAESIKTFNSDIVLRKSGALQECYPYNRTLFWAFRQEGYLDRYVFSEVPVVQDGSFRYLQAVNIVDIQYNQVDNHLVVACKIFDGEFNNEEYFPFGNAARGYALKNVFGHVKILHGGIRQCLLNDEYLVKMPIIYSDEVEIENELPKMPGCYNYEGEPGSGGGGGGGGGGCNPAICDPVTSPTPCSIDPEPCCPPSCTNGDFDTPIVTNPPSNKNGVSKWLDEIKPEFLVIYGSPSIIILGPHDYILFSYMPLKLNVDSEGTLTSMADTGKSVPAGDFEVCTKSKETIFALVLGWTHIKNGKLLNKPLPVPCMCTTYSSDDDRKGDSKIGFWWIPSPYQYYNENYYGKQKRSLIVYYDKKTGVLSMRTSFGAAYGCIRSLNYDVNVESGNYGISQDEPTVVPVFYTGYTPKCGDPSSPPSCDDQMAPCSWTACCRVDGSPPSSSSCDDTDPGGGGSSGGGGGICAWDLGPGGGGGGCPSLCDNDQCRPPEDGCHECDCN